MTYDDGGGKIIPKPFSLSGNRRGTPPRTDQTFSGCRLFQSPGPSGRYFANLGDGTKSWVVASLSTAVYYFENTPQGSETHRLLFTEDGQIQHAPTGFFDTYMIIPLLRGWSAIESLADAFPENHRACRP